MTSRYRPPRDIALAPKPGFNDGQSTFTGLPPDAIMAEPEPGDSITFTGDENPGPIPPPENKEGSSTVSLKPEEVADQLANARAIEMANKRPG